MARACDICGKGTQVGNNRKLLRGHYNVTSKRTFKPNLQKVKHEGDTVRACVNCIRTKNKTARVSA